MRGTPVILPDQVAVGRKDRPTLRLLSYNIQVGIEARRASDYFLNSWKHVVPHAGRARNLDRMAEILAEHDIIGLQETDAGSLRSGSVNITEYLARKAGLEYWHHKVNRSFGNLARHAHGLISRLPPHLIENHDLPGLIPGRGVVVARYGEAKNPLTVFHAHLSLTRNARRNQLAFIAELLGDHPHAVLMGDFNCRADSPEMQELFRKTSLIEPAEVLHTYPSWRPQSNIDHVLVTPSLEVVQARVLPHAYSDHLPVSVEVVLPGRV